MLLSTLLLVLLSISFFIISLLGLYHSYQEFINNIKSDYSIEENDNFYDIVLRKTHLRELNWKIYNTAKFNNLESYMARYDIKFFHIKKFLCFATFLCYDSYGIRLNRKKYKILKKEIEKNIIIHNNEIKANEILFKENEKKKAKELVDSMIKIND